MTDRAEKEQRWLAANREEYSGQWVALDGDRLLAAGTSSEEVFASVAGYEPTPLVIRIVGQDFPFAGW